MASEKDKTRSGVLEGPGVGSYNGHNGPTSKDLKVPVKDYPASSKIGHDRGSDVLDGPGCAGKGGYHK